MKRVPGFTTPGQRMTAHGGGDSGWLDVLMRSASADKDSPAWKRSANAGIAWTVPCIARAIDRGRVLKTRGLRAFEFLLLRPVQVAAKHETQRKRSGVGRVLGGGCPASRLRDVAMSTG